jgi:hypothetical protein
MKWLYGLTFIWIALGLAIFALLIFADGAQAAQRCEIAVELVSLEGIPAEAKPGEIFRTSWLLRDKNSCGWPSGLQLLFADGERMSGPSKLDLNSPDRGQDLEISFDLQASKELGDHFGAWQLAVEGRNLGPQLDVNFKVVEEDKEEAPVPDLPEGIAPPETFIEFGNWADLASESIAEASVQCSEGIVTGGGWTLLGGSYGPRVYRSVMDDNGWSVSARNDSSHDIEMRAYAICLRNIPDGVVTLEIQEWVEIPSHSVDGGDAECPEWGVRTGGGFDVFAYNNMEMHSSGPNGGNNQSWHLGVRNNSFISETAKVTVVCLIGFEEVSSSTVFNNDAMLQPMEEIVPSGYTEASCPAGKQASGGGMGFTGFIYFESMLEGETWFIRAFNPYQVAFQFSASVVCLDF